MKAPVSLQYANRRVHRTSIETNEEIAPGYEFELHGRRWRAVQLTQTSRTGLKGAQEGRMLCVAVKRP